MKISSYHVLRVGLAITFIGVAIYIFREPLAWGGMMQPWAMRLMPVPLTTAMYGTAVLDLAVGLALLADVLVWAAAALGALHLVTVMILVGLTDVTIRDVGLLFASASLSMQTWPEKFAFWKKRT